jgi:hypothetical protein
MELNGALSNPLANHKGGLGKLSELHRRLLAKAATAPVMPRRGPGRPIPVLEVVTTVLELAGVPMRACEIHAAATQLVGESIRWSSVKGVLSAHTIGGDRRFRRIRRGCYELAPDFEGFRGELTQTSPELRNLLLLSDGLRRSASPTAERLPRAKCRAPAMLSDVPVSCRVFGSQAAAGRSGASPVIAGLGVRVSPSVSGSDRGCRSGAGRVWVAWVVARRAASSAGAIGGAQT